MKRYKVEYTHINTNPYYWLIKKRCKTLEAAKQCYQANVIDGTKDWRLVDSYEREIINSTR